MCVSYLLYYEGNHCLRRVLCRLLCLVTAVFYRVVTELMGMWICLVVRYNVRFKTLACFPSLVCCVYALYAIVVAHMSCYHLVFIFLCDVRYCAVCMVSDFDFHFIFIPWLLDLTHFSCQYCFVLLPLFIKLHFFPSFQKCNISLQGCYRQQHLYRLMSRKM